ncbi:MAG: amino acid adenylation domain-containing protein [Vicinamibacterales bacterium]
MAEHLADYLEASARRFPERTAVVDPSGRRLSYAELNQQSDALAAFLANRGIVKGDRVGVVMPKSAAGIVSLFAIMKAGAAYVPVDPLAPAERGRRILTDCQIRALITDERRLAVAPTDQDAPATIVVVGSQTTVNGCDQFEAIVATSAARLTRPRALSDLAYILYTSGSTGIPKGVMLTHENAVSFVDWCSSVFEPNENDRFGNHAPFHFDLSVLDIYVSLKHGATLFLVSEDLGKSPKDLARFIALNALTIWYSTPSILTLLLQFGHLNELDFSSLRIVLFAGEVFPVKHLRALVEQWPWPAFYNLYGPTETNVCTFAKIPAAIPADREAPYPIGPACSHCASLVLNDERQEVETGAEGLLYISGPSVFVGYWNRPTEDAAAFLERDGVRWYNTGDVVTWGADGFIYAGRRDRMVKRRGYRIELGEIERALYLHPTLQEVAVLATADADAGIRIVAFASGRPGQPTPSLIELKQFCATKVPAYMIPDQFVVQQQLPRTSTDKVDYQSLKRMAATPRVA